jgi:hypothetical protein
MADETKPDAPRDGLERKNGVLMAMIHKGQRYELPGTNDEDFQEIERFLLENRVNPLLAIKDELAAVRDDPRLTEMLVDRAYRDMRKAPNVDQISQSEVADYLNTRDGTVHALWLMIRRQHPEVTWEQTRTMFSEVSTAEAQKRLDDASAKTLARSAPRSFSGTARPPEAKSEQVPKKAAEETPPAEPDCPEDGEQRAADSEPEPYPDPSPNPADIHNHPGEE